MNEEEWIERNIKKRECVKYVRLDRNLSNEIQSNISCPDEIKDLCFCCKDHRGSVDVDYNFSAVWSKENNTATEATDAFGEAVLVEVHGDGSSKEATRFKYVRIDEDVDLHLVKSLLLDIWKIPRPKLVLSVIGDILKNEYDDARSARLKKQMEDGLKKFSFGPGAWLLTDGLYDGLSSIIGEVVLHCQLDNIISIGVYSWGLLNNTSQLKNDQKNDMKPREIRVMASKDFEDDQIGKGSTHYLLVDNGTYHPLTCQQSFQNFRTSLESYLTKTEDVPAVAILFGGWSCILDAVKKALDENTPIVVIKGSGGYGDILAKSLEIVNDLSKGIDAVEVDTLTRNLKEKAEAEEQLNQFEKGVYTILQDLEKRNLLTVYDIDHSEDDLFVAIVQTLLNVTTRPKLYRLLEIFCPSRVYGLKNYAGRGSGKLMKTVFRAASKRAEQKVEQNRGVLVTFLIEAIFLDKAEYAELILDRGGVNLAKDVSMKMLKGLYFRGIDDIPLQQEGHKNSKCDIFKLKTKLERVKKMLYNIYCEKCKLLKCTCDVRGKQSDDAEPCPSRDNTGLRPFTARGQTSLKASTVTHLFLWSVLANKAGITRLLLTKMDDVIISAMVGSALLDKITKQTKKNKQQSELRRRASVLTSYAAGTAETCFKNDKERTMNLLAKKKKENQWNVAVLDLAIKGTNKNILDTDCFRDYLTDMWKKPVFVNPSDIHYKRKRFVAFWQIPVVKYTVNLIFYVCFLGLFAHVLMVELKSIPFSPLEAVLCFYVIAFAVEEIIQMKRSSFSEYRRDIWNIIDTLSMVVFMLGAILRLFERTYPGGRIVLSLDFMLFFWRLLHIFAASNQLGPMLIMIKRMLLDNMVPYMIVMIVFIFSYAIASEAILYPNSVWSVKFVLFIPRKAFWQIFGEFFLEDIEGNKDGCTTDPNDGNLNRCPSDEGKIAVPIVMAFYILITNVLLLNLLIAMFSSTIKKVQKESDKIWAWQKIKLTIDYWKRSAVPPPFSLLYRVYQLFTQIHKIIRNTCEERYVAPEGEETGNNSMDGSLRTNTAKKDATAAQKLKEWERSMCAVHFAAEKLANSNLV